jgi:hypothetical protein
MKQMAIEDLAMNVDKLIKAASKEKVVLTRNGEPFAFVSDASGYDWEDIGYMSDPDFRKMIAERRKGRGGIALEDVEAELAQREKMEKHGANRPNSPKRNRTKRSRSAA